MFSLFVIVAMLAGLAHGGSVATCGLSGDSWDVVDGNAQINGRLCVNELSVGGTVFIPPVPDPCEKIVYDTTGAARRTRVANCCSRHEDCAQPGDFNHFTVCENERCIVKQRFSRDGIKVCQSDAACAAYKSNACQKAICNFEHHYDFGSTGSSSSSSSSSSWSSSGSSGSWSLDSESGEVRYLGDLPQGVGVCEFETLPKDQCCTKSSDCQSSGAPYHEGGANCCKQQICDASHTCVAFLVPCQCGDTLDCATDAECLPLPEAHKRKEIGEGLGLLAEEDCHQTVCKANACVEDETFVGIVRCYTDADNDGFAKRSEGELTCEPIRRCFACEDGETPLLSNETAKPCDCDDDNDAVPASASYSRCGKNEDFEEYDEDCDNFECPWDPKYAVCKRNGDGACGLQDEDGGYALYAKYSTWFTEFQPTLKNENGGITEDCDGAWVSSVSAQRVCVMGQNIGFLYNLSGFANDCVEEYNFGALPGSAPDNIFVNLLFTEYTSSLSSSDSDGGFDIGVYAGAQHSFCTAIYDCVTTDDCSDEDLFEVIPTAVPHNATVGPKCMVDTHADGGEVYVPCGYCGEWVHGCALGYPEKQAHISPLARTAHGQEVCSYAVGAAERSIEIQQCI